MSRRTAATAVESPEVPGTGSFTKTDRRTACTTRHGQRGIRNGECRWPSPLGSGTRERPLLSAPVWAWRRTREKRKSCSASLTRTPRHGRIQIIASMLRDAAHKPLPPARKEALRQRVSVLTEQLRAESKTASQLMAVAYGYRFLDRSEDALHFAEESVRLDPSCLRCEKAYAFTLLDVNKPKEALEAAENALGLLHEETRGTQLTSTLQLIKECRSAVEKASPTSPHPP